MGSPWEKYQASNPTPAPTAAPWDKYQAPQEEPGLIQSALESKPVQYGMRGLDYLGGLGRVGIGEPAIAAGSQLFGGKPVLQSADIARALKGNAPSTKELLERAGVPAGKSLSDVLPSAYSEAGSGGLPSFSLPEKGGPLDPTARGAAGFMGDVALDPLTYLSLGATGFAKTALSPAEAALKSGGENLYASGLKNVNRAIAKYGKEPISPALMEAGAWGGPQALSQASEDIINKLGQHKQTLAGMADQLGGKVNMQDALKRALEQSAEMQHDPATMGIGKSMSEHLGQYLMAGKEIPVSTASGWKRSINQSLGSEAFNMAKQTKPGQKILKTFQNDLDKAIEEGANQALPELGLGTKMSAADDAMAPMLQARPQFQTEIQKSVTRNAITPVDAMLGGAAAMAHQSPGRVAAIMAVKKLADLSKTPTFRTGGGQALYNLGNYGSKLQMDPMLRRGVWQGIYDQGQNQ